MHAVQVRVCQPGKLSVAMVSDYIHTAVLPKMMEQQGNNNPLEPHVSKEDKVQALLKKKRTYQCMFTHCVPVDKEA
jgi:hypothetical protein